MKSKYLVVTMLAMLCLLVTPLVIADKPVQCEVEITLDLINKKWDGVISGDIEGTFVITPDPNPSFPGSTEHFLETWVITPDSGGEIMLYQEGVWNFKTGRWRSNGMVTAASSEWVHLIGCNVHVRGVTTLPIQHGMTGEGRLQISSYR